MKSLPVLTTSELEEIAAYVVRTEKAATIALLQGQPTEETLLSIADRAHAVADEATRFASSRSSESDQPACARGCDACCYLHVVATVPEVLRIAVFSKSHLSISEQASICERIDQEIEFTQNQTALERRGARIPCPLLDIEKRECKVHPVRPVACRGWNSLDADICNHDREHPELDTKAKVNLGQYLLVNKITEGYRAALTELGKDNQSLDLARGLKAAFDNPRLGEAWLADDRSMSGAINDRIFM